MESAWRILGAVRVYLTGRVCLESGALLVDETSLPGRQGRLLLAYLVLERFRPVTRDELVALLWPDDPPGAADAGLSALVSKLRRRLAQAGGGLTISGGDGSYELKVPSEVWIDVERAVLAADQAEAALRTGDHRTAWAAANVAAAVARRPLLPGIEGPWLDGQRARLRTLLTRSLDTLAGACLATGQTALAIASATELVHLEPFRESGYRSLMRAHRVAGDRGEALRVYDRCRRLLADELGVSPSPPTEELYLALLGADADGAGEASA